MKLYKQTRCEYCDETRMPGGCENCQLGYRYDSLSPAALQAAGLAGWAVVEEIKSWLKEKAPRVKSPDEPVRVLNVDSFEKAIAELESKHSALDKYRETRLYSLKQVELAVFNHDSDGAESSKNQHQVRCQQWWSIKTYLLANKGKQARAEVERGQEGEEKNEGNRN